MSLDSMLREVVSCKVITHLPYGLLVELESGERGLIRTREISWDAGERSSWKQRFPPGAKLSAVVMKRPEGRYVELSARLAQEDPWERVYEFFHEGQMVTGVVTGVKHYGAFVEIVPGLTGLLHETSLPSHPRQDIMDMFWPGDLVRVSIQKIDRRQKQMSLALAPVHFSERPVAAAATALPAAPIPQRASPHLPFDLLMDLDAHYEILLVEDDTETAASVEAWLDKLGQRVNWVTSAEAALECLEKERPDLMLVDLGLPEMSGIELIRIVSQRWPTVRCVLNTTPGIMDHHLREVEDLQQAGIALLYKPLLPEDLMDLLLNLVQETQERVTQKKPDLVEGAMPDIQRTSILGGLRKLMQRCLDTTEFDLAVLFQLDGAHRKIDIVNQYGRMPGVQPYLDDLIYSPVRDVAEDGDLVRVEDIIAERSDARFRYLLQAYPCRAVLGVRIPNNLLQDYGLFLFNETPREIFDDEVTFAQATALGIGSLLERRLLTDQLRATQKTTMLGHLSSYLAHEVNHGLTSLNSSMDNLDTRLERLSASPNTDPAQLERALAEAQEQSRALRKTVKSLSDTVRAFRDLLMVGKKQIVNMDELVQETLALMQQTSRVSRVSLVFQPGEGLMAIRSQMALLRHVLLNLVVNAVQQITDTRPIEGGVVKIRIEKDTPTDAPAIIRILVEDNGPGIHWRLWEKIFEAGFTTRTDGSGLGLYISRNLIESLGGRLYVKESYLYSGTTFAVELPYQI